MFRAKSFFRACFVLVPVVLSVVWDQVSRQQDSDNSCQSCCYTLRMHEAFLASLVARVTWNMLWFLQHEEMLCDWSRSDQALRSDSDISAIITEPSVRSSSLHGCLTKDLMFFTLLASRSCSGQPWTALSTRTQFKRHGPTLHAAMLLATMTGAMCNPSRQTVNNESAQFVERYDLCCLSVNREHTSGSVWLFTMVTRQVTFGLWN